MSTPKETRQRVSVWSIGNATCTIFRDGDPTGAEVHAFNGGDHHDLITQANMVPKMVEALRKIADVPAVAFTRDQLEMAGRTIDAMQSLATEALAGVSK